MPMRAWSGCMRPGARPRRLRRVLPRSPKNARRIGGVARRNFSRRRSTTPADAAQAFVNLTVFPSHLLQGFHRLCLAAGLGLALGGQRNGLTLVTCFALGLRVD